MNTFEFPQREILIERLVNNELSAVERSRLLVDTENHENGWRQIALAFVESQVLHESLNEIVENENKEEADDKKVALAKATKKASVKQRFGFLATAACVLVSLVGGLMVGNAISKKSNSVAPGPGVAANSDVQPIDELPKDSLVQDTRHPGVNQVNHSVLKVPNGKSNEYTEIPMIDFQEMDRGWEDLITQEVRDAFYKEGYSIKPSTRFVRGQLEDDREFVYPIHELEFRSIAR